MKTATSTFTPLAFLSILIIFFNGCSNTNSEDSTQNGLIAQIDSIAQSYLDSGKMVGFSIAVLKNNEPVYAKGFGYSDWENKTPVTENTIFPMASITKLHTATATMVLVEQGKLSLDNTLLEMMPDFPRPEQAKKIKIRHLLSHTSGLADYAEYGDSLFVQENIFPTKQHYFDFFERNDLYFEPGTTYAYSNSGFILMGFIIEELSGLQYEDFIEQYIAQPAGMASLKHLNRNKKNNTSLRYDLKDSSFVISMMDTVYYFKGDGGLSATATDLAKLPFNLVDGKIISKKSLETMMQTFQFPDGNKSEYGLGLRNGNFEGQQVWGHTGGHINYWSTLAYYPAQQTSIVVFANTDLSPVDALLIEGEVALAVLGIEKPNLEKMEVAEKELQKYAGEYSNVIEAYNSDRTIVMVQYPNEKKLYRKRKGSDAKGEKLYYLGNHTFAPSRYPMDRIVFNINEQGEIVGYRNYYNGLFLQLKKRRE